MNYFGGALPSGAAGAGAVVGLGVVGAGAGSVAVFGAGVFAAPAGVLGMPSVAWSRIVFGCASEIRVPT